MDRALERLAALDPGTRQPLELRFVAGSSVEATGELLKTAPITILREWYKAKV
jgi:hypothetical protein